MYMRSAKLAKFNSLLIILGVIAGIAGRVGVIEVELVKSLLGLIVSLIIIASSVEKAMLIKMVEELTGERYE